MRNGILKKWIFINIVIFITVSGQGFTKETIHMFTNVNKCKSCNNPVLDALVYSSQLFDSLDIEYELILKCRRRRELEDYRDYYKLDDRLKIVALNDSISDLYNPSNTENFFIITRNDTIIFTTERLETLNSFIIR